MFKESRGTKSKLAAGVFIGLIGIGGLTACGPNPDGPEAPASRSDDPAGSQRSEAVSKMVKAMNGRVSRKLTSDYYRGIARRRNQEEETGSANLHESVGKTSLLSIDIIDNQGATGLSCGGFPDGHTFSSPRARSKYERAPNVKQAKVTDTAYATFMTGYPLSDSFVYDLNENDPCLTKSLTDTVGEIKVGSSENFLRSNKREYIPISDSDYQVYVEGIAYIDGLLVGKENLQHGCATTGQNTD